ncbi:MAG: Gldg family protein [Halioglobus sp.]
MKSNSISRRVAQKELRLFFSSPVAWLLLAGFSASCLFIFFWVETFFARNVADVRPLFEWMPILLIFLTAALTMRMWSEERRNGTLEHITTQPQGLWRFALGKFLACFVLLLVALLCTFSMPLTVALNGDLDWGPVFGGYLATVLLGAAYLSIGLWVSSRTHNPIVSLIGTVLLCSVLYFIGTSLWVDFFSERTAEILRSIGSGARFDSVSRGVLDARDLVYYLTLTLVFLSLNVYELEKERWAQAATTPRHRRWHIATFLIVANAVVANIWIGKIESARVDLTQGNLYSITQPSLEILEQLEEPLLIRGYFSAKTHPLLSPLAPQLQDLISEYAAAAKGEVYVEFIDPAEDPELEKEANKYFGINATPFQVSDRHQSALVNSYFNVLVQYGDEFETLGFADLIEVKATGNARPEVLLRNPEFDITRAVKRVLQRFQASGDLFEGIDSQIELIAYVSNEQALPKRLVDYKKAIELQLKNIAQHSSGKFSIRFIEPEARDGMVARQIRDEWGFKPMVAALTDDQEFYFYLTLADRHQVVQLPTENFDPSKFPAMLDAGLKRFAKGFTRTVALATPQLDKQAAKFSLGAPSYANLENAITKNYSIRNEDLSDGMVTSQADILVVVGPKQLQEKEIFAIDQYLMRGGTLVLATSPYSAEITGGDIRMLNWDSGLDQWLDHQGIAIEKALVLDEQNASFPLPVIRESGGEEFTEMKVVDYPFFVDIRPGGLATDHPITRDLPQLTMAWPSPLKVARNPSRRVTTLLRSSPESWATKSTDVTPRHNAVGKGSFEPIGPKKPQTLGIAIQGRFDSWFTDRVDPMLSSDTLIETPVSPGSRIRSVIDRSPESSRIVVFASNDFLDDQILSAVAAAAGTKYLSPLELLVNTLDWSLQDNSLLEIRSRGQFNRTLAPMKRKQQRTVEYANYGAVAILLLLLAVIHFLRKRYRVRYYTRRLSQ